MATKLQKKLQNSILGSIAMVEQGEACTLLGATDADQSVDLQQLEAENRILRVDWQGKAAYPLFQFDVANHQVHPTIIKILTMRTDDWGGSIALVEWLTRPSRSLGGKKPCERLSEDADMIVELFYADLTEHLFG